MISNRIVSRIKKLMALSKGSEGNEAEVAAKMARRLMMEHAISQADLENMPDPSDNAIDGFMYFIDKNSLTTDMRDAWSRRCAWWRRELFSVLCNYLDMRMSFRAGTAVMTAYGYKNDMEVLEYLFSLCAHQIDAAAKAHLRDLRDRGYYTTKSHGTAFRNSAVKGLRSKLSELKREGESENPQGTALMVSRKRAISSWVDDNIEFSKKKVAWGSTQRSYSSAGYTAGRNVKLSRGVGGVSRQTQKLA